ncbi:uncharacterized protein LOC141840347 isoform X2 [Curcuma longa]|uniref:uncharacterized protein LOC141840347 isoform X2 n=1 Tax=Curcuma longa TaxID=136217 RepID=UPI003D9F87E5
MASVSGSGRKILHDRLRDQPPRPSAYARSTPLALPPPPPPAGSPRWLLGLVSGAGKLISSVFRADSGSPDSSDYSSDQDSSSSRSDEQNVDAPKQLHGSRRELKKSEMEVSHAIVPVSETKLAIEKLLQQETFSRDECERLTKLLQSRVVDSPSVFVQDKVGEAISNGLPGNTGDFSGAWLSLQQCNVLPESDVHDDAPVDLAKSYMQSLPPQQSPSVGSITLSSMIASKEDLQTDSSNHARTSNSLSSIKESPDSNKKPHLILEDTLQENPSLKLIDSQELFQMETSKISSAADERDPYFLRTVQFSSSLSSLETSNAPAKSLVEHVEDLHRNDGGNLVDKPINEDVTTVTVKSTSATLTSEPMETLKASVEKTASPTISSLGPTLSDTPTEHKLPIYLDANKDVGKPSSTVLEDIINDDAPHESSISASASKVPDDAKSQDQNLCSLNATDGSGNEFSRKGGSTESNVNPQLVSQENQSFTQFSNGEQTTDVAKVTKEHPSMDTAPAHGENHITTKSPKVAKRKSIEHVSVSPRPRTRQHVSVSPRPRTRQQATREGKVVREREQSHRQGRVSK